mmetsp:Transcript_31463/g.68587  ORF Transcript_31463/g.68587 Transcript_31463/m.68587 type:complete len:142 (-) Transcript_31463:14-439(-)
MDVTDRGEAGSICGSIRLPKIIAWQPAAVLRNRFGIGSDVAGDVAEGDTASRVSKVSPMSRLSSADSRPDEVLLSARLQEDARQDPRGHRLVLLVWLLVSGTMAPNDSSEGCTRPGRVMPPPIAPRRRCAGAAWSEELELS